LSDKGRDTVLVEPVGQREPMRQSCDWLDTMAPWTCRVDAAGRCDWYHGTWQYLKVPRARLAMRSCSVPALPADIWSGQIGVEVDTDRVFMWLAVW
jgi:hypothetical protein